MPRHVVLLKTIDKRGGLVEGAHVELYEDEDVPGVWVRVVTLYPIQSRRHDAPERWERGYYALESDEYRRDDPTDEQPQNSEIALSLPF